MGHDSSNGKIPKTIWIMWQQGFANAPRLVQKCLESWRQHNPNWQIVLLEEQNMGQYLNLREIIGKNQAKITVQAISNLVRINILAKLGGVWVDATCFCCQPLDYWLYSYMPSGFFAFERPGQDRLLSTWFMASIPDCHLTKAYCEMLNAYWRRNYFSRQKTERGEKIIKQIHKYLVRNAGLASLWVHPLTAKLLRVYPYHWFHYSFYRLIAKDRISRQIWEATPKFSADIPHTLKNAGMLNPLTAEIKKAIDDRQAPLYKLNWRLEKNMSTDCILSYVLASVWPLHHAAISSNKKNEAVASL